MYDQVNISNLVSFLFGAAVLWVVQKLSGKLIPRRNP